MKVEVRNNNVDAAIRILKKKLQQDGVFNEMRNKEYHRTKGEKKRLAWRNCINDCMRFSCERNENI